MNGTKIRRITKMTLLVGLCMLGALVPKAKADEENQKTIFTFSGPVEIPGKVLPAGTYVFKLLSPNLEGDRNIVQVFSKNGKTLYGTFLAIPDSRMKSTGKTVVTFEERAAGSPEAIKAWFYPGDTNGHEFVYPKSKAVELAKANNTPVPSMPDELAANTTQPAATKNEPAVMAMRRAPLKAQKPNEEEVEITEVFMVAPLAASLPTRLPKTASELPLIGLIGLLSIGMAISLRFTRAKIT